MWMANQFTGFYKKRKLVVTDLDNTNLVTRAISKKYPLFRFPLIAKKCAGDEVEIIH